MRILCVAMTGQKRYVEQGMEAVEDATSAASGPASGSLVVVEPYPGSRRLRQRFKYKDGSRSELVPSWRPSPEQFKAYLAEVPGVVRVEWNTSKGSQGNPSPRSLLPAKYARLQLNHWARLCQSSHRV